MFFFNLFLQNLIVDVTCNPLESDEEVKLKEIISDCFAGELDSLQSYGFRVTEVDSVNCALADIESKILKATKSLEQKQLKPEVMVQIKNDISNLALDMLRKMVKDDLNQWEITKMRKGFAKEIETIINKI